MERLQSGTPFPELAAAFSEDPESSRRGGDMASCPVSQLKKTAPALRDAVLSKSPGTATVATVNGVHTIVFVLEHELAGQRDLSTRACATESPRDFVPARSSCSARPTSLP
jgi:hypothetical protein